MHCLNCGHNNSPFARFCVRCGASLSSVERPTAHTSLQPGQTMNGGQYRVMRQLTEGSMGTIYLAENIQAFDRSCVIKEMIAYYEPGQELRARERFELEARTLAALKHPGIPDMYGFFTEQGHNYIVMEYIEGQNLEQALQMRATPGAGLSAEEVLHYGVQICRVLEYLASVVPEPVVHCDIKPANIIVEANSQQAVLVDFGTAKTRYLGRGADPLATPGRPHPHQDSVYGTVGYAAPELYRGEATSRSDVYSLAATLYHLLSGDDPRDHPFQWPHMDRLSLELAAILEPALAHDINARPDAGLLRHQLEAYRVAQGDVFRPLAFPNGNQASTLSDLLGLSLSYWTHARDLLYDGALETWLRHTLRDPAAAHRAAEAVHDYPLARDSGLDAFVRGLNPHLPPPQLSLSQSVVDLGAIRPGELPSFSVILNNRGPGGARGTIEASVAGVEAHREGGGASFAVAPSGSARLTFRLSATDRLPKRKQSVIIIRLVLATGGTLDIQVRLTVGPPSRRAALTGSQPPSPAPPASSAATGAGAARTKPGTGALRKRRRSGMLLLLFALLILSAVFLTFRGTPAASETGVQKGIEALDNGDWQRAAAYLARLDASIPAHVAEVALFLDDEMVLVPGGTLRMGDEDGTHDQRPEHNVPIEELWLDRFEVTNVQYQRFVFEANHPPPPTWPDGFFPAGKALYPVVGVTWHDACAYAEWVGKRLPTEAEWEWAARGVEGRAYPWGNVELRHSSNSASSGTQGVAAVGSCRTGATPLGIQDMAGNVREWTADYYAAYSDPHIPPAPSDLIAVRGSSWRTYNDLASARDAAPPDTRADDLGFRCAR